MTRRCSVLKNAVIVMPCMLLFAVLMLSACGKRDSYRAAESINVAAVENKAPLSYAEEPAAADELEGTTSASGPANPPAGRLLGSYASIPKKIIKEGTIRYSVGDYQRSRKELIAIIFRNGGEIVSERENRSEIAWETQLEIRVPSAKFDTCLDALAGADGNLIDKNITSKDVTEEYVDVSARMKARKEVEQRYLDILKQAKTVEDILKVEEQLKSIREEVEAAQGRLQYIDHNVSMSVIHLSFYQTFSNTTPQGPGFFSRLFFAAKDGWNGVLGSLIGFAELWPLWIALAAVIIIIRRYRKRRRLMKAVA